MCYIQGGKPEGGMRTYEGCTDKSQPRDDKAVYLPQQLYFAGESRVWTGGVCFLSHENGIEPTRSRAYLITMQQFEEVVAQENWNIATKYNEIIHCGEKDGFPVLSFTSSTELRPYTKPAPAYLHMIASGLMGVHSMSPADIAGYLLTKPGVSGNYTYAQLLEIIPIIEPSSLKKAAADHIDA